MPVSIDQVLGKILQEQRHVLRTDAMRRLIAPRSDKLEEISREVAGLREQIAMMIKPYLNQFSNAQVIDFQLRLNKDLDDCLNAAIQNVIERRTWALAEQARRDSLTTLYNRSTFDHRLNEELERARRYHREFSLILLDVDHFKSINDRFGHQKGDQVLSQIAEILRSSLRQSDSAFRYGGDEFAAICPETSGEAIVNVLRRIETNLINYFLEMRLDPTINVSWGMASFPIDASDTGGLIRAADLRLYSCKKEHHNCLSTRL